ncbi:MAG TPA: DivIVA domain-containing protein [Gemmatimonadaceae bacterium]|nr:DivIVA domain-containing protein [Gemmatimonadaceae bacterium]
MSDEIFHLTPVDVRRMEFPKSMRGYDRDRVDYFREAVADELERLTRANQELESKLRSFQEQLRDFRDRDKALNDALVSAQQLRAEVREQSEREAQLILREARAEGDRALEDARFEMLQLQGQIAALARVRRGYLAQFRVMLERQLAEIAAEEEVPDPQVGSYNGESDGAPASPPGGTAGGAPRSGALFRG